MDDVDFEPGSSDSTDMKEQEEEEEGEREVEEDAVCRHSLGYLRVE